MRTVSQLKGGGYLTSILSVVLLAVPAFKSAMESTVMLVCLIGGMLASIAGMGLRWRSHRLEQRQQSRTDSRQNARDAAQDRALVREASFG